MKDIVNRFLSRKFLLTVAGVVLVLLVPEHADSVVQVIGYFIGAEGARDLAEAVRRNK